jgi:hypothetical protein
VLTVVNNSSREAVQNPHFLCVDCFPVLRNTHGHSSVLSCRVANCKATGGHFIMHLIVFEIVENEVNTVSQTVKKPCN